MNQWALFEVFVRVGEAGSMTAAARTLGISQPTVSRHIRALEQQLGGTLFFRHGRGLALTDRGRRLLAEAREIDHRVQGLLRSGASGEIAGTVRVSCLEYFGTSTLIPVFAALRREHAGLAIEVAIATELADLSRGEADIALRAGVAEPTSGDLLAREVGTLELGLYATSAYLKAAGVPQGLEDLRGHRLIGQPGGPRLDRFLRPAGLVSRDIGFRCNSARGRLAAVQAGMGIGGLLVAMAEEAGDLVRVLPEVPLFETPLWLLMRVEHRNDRAVRAVFDGIERALKGRSVPAHRAEANGSLN